MFPRKKFFLFDFDGTLFDSAIDLIASVNRLLTKRHLPEIPYETLRKEAGRGVEVLIPTAFHITKNDSLYPTLRKEFLDDYQEHCTDHPILFPGAGKLLTALHQQQIPWAIITNKPRSFLDQIVEKLPILETASLFVTPENIKNTKPHPEGLLLALQRLHALPQDALYVGDDERDAQAAQAANIYFVAAAYGYLGRNPDVNSWKSDRIVQTLDELLDQI